MNLRLPSTLSKAFITVNMALIAGLSLCYSSAAPISRDFSLACYQESVEGLPLEKTLAIAAANS
jgi:hypothetical protein